MARPRELDLDLVRAQQARRALDYLVGFHLSALLWRKVRGGRSAGRVQSVALRLLCAREAEIEAFEPEAYWTVDAAAMAARGGGFTARLARLDGEALDRGRLRPACRERLGHGGAPVAFPSCGTCTRCTRTSSPGALGFRPLPERNPRTAAQLSAQRPRRMGPAHHLAGNGPDEPHELARHRGRHHAHLLPGVIQAGFSEAGRCDRGAGLPRGALSTLRWRASQRDLPAQAARSGDGSSRRCRRCCR